MTDHNLCGCGRRKRPVSARCQGCHMKHMHRRRKLKHEARLWAERAMAGSSIVLEAGEGMTPGQFGHAVGETIEAVRN